MLPGHRGAIRRLHWVKRWMYRGGRPQRLAKVLNRLSALQFSAGLLSPGRGMTLEVRGRRTGRTISLPVVVADYEGERYLVSMLDAAPGARPHVPVDRHAALEEFERIADRFPVSRIVPRPAPPR